QHCTNLEVRSRRVLSMSPDSYSLFSFLFLVLVLGVVVSAVRLHRLQKETWRTNKTRVCQGRFFENSRDLRARAVCYSEIKRSEEHAMKISAIGPHFPSKNRPDPRTRLRNRLPCDWP